MRKKLAAIIFWFWCFIPETFAQDEKHVEMADEMRKNGKIYVVVFVLVVILAGLFIYLFRLDRKISKLEKKD